MESVRLYASDDRVFVEQTQKKSGPNISVCPQYGKCTAGCPVSFAYDFPVFQIMRLLQASPKHTHFPANCSPCCWIYTRTRSKEGET